MTAVHTVVCLPALPADVSAAVIRPRGSQHRGTRQLHDERGWTRMDEHHSSVQRAMAEQLEACVSSRPEVGVGKRQACAEGCHGSEATACVERKTDKVWTRANKGWEDW